MKSGLPSLSNDLPTIGGLNTIDKAQIGVPKKPAVKFNDFDDDFSAGDEDELDVNEANNDDDYDDDDQDGDFDANELLDLGGY